jgi:hypothetical protein
MPTAMSWRSGFIPRPWLCSTFDFVNGFAKNKTNKDMAEIIKYCEVKKYFNWQFISLFISLYDSLSDSLF